MQSRRKFKSYQSSRPVRLFLFAAALAVALTGGGTGLLSSGPSGNAGGLIPAQFTTTPTGAAVFQIPLATAPGRNGLQPSLSLNYHSQNSTNGVAGIGWSLGGLSAIERCGKTIPLDGETGGVTGWLSDRLCMDGVRLQGRRSDTDAYYWSKQNYSKEFDDHSLIIPQGNCGLGHCKFTVLGRDGANITYGGTSDSRMYTVNATGQNRVREIRRWLVSEVRDRNGNTMRFTYAEGGEHTAVIERIEYGGTSVEFSYDTRHNTRDQLLQADGTGQTKMKKLLRKISARTADGEFKRYHLSYGSSRITSHSRLEKIEECSANACLDPIEVDWNDAPAPNGAFREIIPAGAQYQNALRYSPGARIIPGDFNGDGRTDFLRQVKFTSETPNIGYNFQVYFSRGDGAFDIITPSGLQYLLPADSAKLIPGDFNGDGKTDFLRQGDNPVHGSFMVYFSRGDGTFDVVLPEGAHYQDFLAFKPGANIIPGDFNGDGKTDFLRQENGGWGKDDKGTFRVYFSRGDGYFNVVEPTGKDYQRLLRYDPGALIIPGDYNGDGKMDFIRQEKGKWSRDDQSGSFKVYFSRGNGSFTIVEPSGAQYQKDLRFDPNASIVPADYNGDGKTDFIAHSSFIMNPSGDRSYFRVYLSRGDGHFDIKSNWRQGYKYNGWLQRDWANIIPLDYNGDGKMDFARQERGEKADDAVESFQIYVSRGDGFFDLKDPAGRLYDYVLRGQGTGGNDQGSSNLFPGDYDGDGRTDLIAQSRGSWDRDQSGNFQVLFAAPAADQAPPETVAGIQQGPVKHAFQYRRLNQYDPNAGMSFPAGHQGIRAPLPVLRSYTRQVPTATATGTSLQTINRTYEFRGATVHTGGRGFQGFQRMRVTAPEEGLSTTVTYNVVYPFSGRTVSSVTKTADGRVELAKTAYTWKQAAGALPETIMVQMTARIDTAIADDGAQIKRTNVSYDSLGNPILRAESDGGRTLYTCSAFNNNYATKRPGFLKGRIQGTNCRASGDSCSCANVLTESRMDLDERGNVTRLHTYDSGRDEWLTESYSYDSRGNQTSRTDPSGAVTTTTYDSTYAAYPAKQTVQADGVSLSRSWRYDARNGKMTRAIDANGNETRYDYDDFGRLTAVHRTAPNGDLVRVETQNYAREADGLYRQTTSVRQSWENAGSTTQSEVRDALNRVVEETAGAGAKRVLRLKQWGARGEILRESEPHRAGQAPGWTEYDYDARHQAAQITHHGGAGARLSYGYGGVCENHQRRITTVLSGGTGRHSVRCENSKGKTVKLVLSDPKSGKSTTQVYTYDAMDRLISAMDGNSVTSFELDSLGRKTRVQSTDRGVVEYRYNAAGQLALEINNGEEKTFVYDALHREKRIEFHDGSYALFEYDDETYANARGSLTRARMYTPGNRESSRREYAYDAAGEIAVTTLTVGGNTYAMGYRTDPQGRGEEVRFADGKRACYSYNDEGFLANIRVTEEECATAAVDGEIFASYSNYSAHGKPGHVEYGNGVITDYEYDRMNRLKSAVTLGRDKIGANGTLLDQRYTWTPLGEVQTIEDRAGDNDASFTYDGMGYLVRAAGLYGDLDYEYDAAGNLKRKEGREIFYAGSRPTGADDGLALNYDAHGNVIRRTKADGTVYDLEYDGMYKIRRIARNGVQAGTYEYDAGGQRVKKLDGYGIETIYVNPDYEVARYPDGRVLATRYVSSPTGRVAAITTEDSDLAAMTVGPAAAASHALQAQMYNTGSISGLAGFSAQTTAAIVQNPRNAMTLRALFWTLCSTAVVSVFLAQLFRTARNRGTVGRLRARLAWALFDLRCLPADRARAFAAAGRETSTYERRRRPLLWPAPIMACVMLSFGLQCGGSGGSGDMPVLLAPANESFAFDADLGPGKNGYGYAEKGTFFFQQDQVGSTSLVTDEEGKVVASTIYKPYGEVYQDRSEGRDIYRSKFNGNEWDRDGEMYYFNARYYDPGLGSFLQSDDLLFGTDGEHPATLNRYAFSGNNPVTFSDPGGNFFLLSILISGLAYAAATAATAATMAATMAFTAVAALGSALWTIGAAIASAAWAMATWSTVGNMAYYAIWYGVSNGFIYHQAAKAAGEEFSQREFWKAFGIGVAAGVVSGGVYSGFMTASAVASSRYATLVARYGVAARGVDQMRRLPWTTLSRAAHYTAWIGGGIVGGAGNKALYQWKMNGHVNARDVVDAGLYGAGFGALGAKLSGPLGSAAYRMLGNLAKKLPQSIARRLPLPAAWRVTRSHMPFRFN